jgi:hypothetical protein
MLYNDIETIARLMLRFEIIGSQILLPIISTERNGRKEKQRKRTKTEEYSTV